MIKIQAFKDKDPFKLAEQINEFNLKYDSFSTQVFPSSPYQEYWTAFVYYDWGKEYRNMNDVNKDIKSGVIRNGETIRVDERRTFNVTKEKLEQWKLIPPTQKTIEKLKKMGFNELDLKYIKTQYDAHVVLNNLDKENI
jgi:hypothetical protein